MSLASETASLPIAWRLYLPRTWARDAGRRRKAGVPEEVVFKTRPEIALEQITAAHEAGVAPGVVLADAGYGNDTGFRDAVSALGLKYAMGVLGSPRLWHPGQEPLAPKSKGGRGCPGTRLRRDEAHRPVSARDLAMSLKLRALADPHLARWCQRAAKQALCCGSRAPGPSRPHALQAVPARRVAHRMAAG